MDVLLSHWSTVSLPMPVQVRSLKATIGLPNQSKARLTYSTCPEETPRPPRKVHCDVVASHSATDSLLPTLVSTNAAMVPCPLGWMDTVLLVPAATCEENYIMNHEMSATCLLAVFESR